MMAETVKQPPSYKRLRTNVVRIRPIFSEEMHWFFNGLVSNVSYFAENFFANNQPKQSESEKYAFYGLLKPGKLFQSLNMSAEWVDAGQHDSKGLSDALKVGGNTLKTFVTNNITKSETTTNVIVKGGKALLEVGEAGITAGRVAFGKLGPVTRKKYSGPQALKNGISIECDFDLAAGQKKLALLGIARLLHMGYPRVYEQVNSDGEGFFDESIDKMFGLFGQTRTYDPYPVELVMGQHFYMSPLAINNIEIRSSNEYFKDDKDLMLPKTITVNISLLPYMLPDPDAAWLTFAGYHMMGDKPGTPYNPGNGAVI